MREDDRRWSLLTAHARVLLCIAADPQTRVREIAETVGISERGAHQIVADLVDAGFVRRARVGRRNRYAIEDRTALRQEPVAHRRVASIIALLGPEPSNRTSSSARREPARSIGRARSKGRAKLTSRASEAKPKRRAA